MLTEGIHSGQGGGVVPSSFRILRRILSRDRGRGDRPASSCPSCSGRGSPTTHRANLEALAAEFPDSAAARSSTGCACSAPDAADRLVARTWGAALEVIGHGRAAQAPREAGNVLRPSTTLKFSLRLPPDVDAQVACDALISAIRTDEGAHVTIDLGGVAQGWVAPPLDADIAAVLDRVSQEHFGRAVGSSARAAPSRSWPTCRRASPGTQFVATGVLGPHSNAHGPNESLHIPMGKAVTHAVAELLNAN